ncbi:hypothetical protein [Candidatus Tremblaya phenacola]|uniref:hypothetical protein n=1 Tax=Candidatus Tremblayella phenacoccinincola TaxID=1010676 RepID=UPI000C07602A|nr:hypothetical protein [Candidatus Tremblaya phenacola]
MDYFLPINQLLVPFSHSSLISKGSTIYCGNTSIKEFIKSVSKPIRDYTHIQQVLLHRFRTQRRSL